MMAGEWCWTWDLSAKIAARFVSLLAFTNDMHLLYLLSSTSPNFHKTSLIVLLTVGADLKCKLCHIQMFVFKQFRSIFRPTSWGLFLLIIWYEVSDMASPWTLTGNISWWKYMCTDNCQTLQYKTTLDHLTFRALYFSRIALELSFCAFYI